MKTFQMRLAPSPFAKIKAGRKTIELRLNDEKRREICVGDKIVFTNIDSGERLVTEVIALHPFESFEALYSALPLDKCGYNQEEIPNASPADMAAYYTTAQQMEHGVLGIELRVLKSI